MIDKPVQILRRSTPITAETQVTQAIAPKPENTKTRAQEYEETKARIFAQEVESNGYVVTKVQPTVYETQSKESKRVVGRIVSK
jgi:hypothetical protein